ncbi:MAG TPA: dephospho-CoA kinase [Mycobacteriales bacterium]|nr:dephospho-CoA kinase [Mycobacteriales bacterium]
MRVGLTGGIGSGKTEVARRLAALGAVVIDYDSLAREVVAPGSAGLAAVVAALGPDVLASDGSLDRARVAQQVFLDEVARRRLNAVVHPLVGARAAELGAAAPEGAVVVHDIPLLVDNGLAPAFDVVIVVTAEESTRLRRLVRRGLSEADARNRIAAQVTDADRRRVASYVIANEGDLEDLDRLVAEVWQALSADVADR